MSRHTLKSHLAAPPDAVGGVSCSVVRQGNGALVLDFHVNDAPAGLSVPDARPPARADGLWRTTCFEMFLREEGAEGYYELNFSPSGLWAAYRFEGYRHNGADLEFDAPLIEWADCRLRASFDGRSFARAGPWRAGLSAVIEEPNGTMSYWALAHPSDKPDFHHPDSFVLELP